MRTSCAGNIRHGGGSRVPEILEVIEHHRPDVVVLTEFRNNAVAPQLLSGLDKTGLRFQSAPGGPAPDLSVLIASRYGFTSVTLERELRDCHGALARVSQM